METNSLSLKQIFSYKPLVPKLICLIFIARQPLVGQILITVEASKSHFRPTTLWRIPLDEWSARRRYRYLQNTQIHKRGTSMP